ncbi:5'-nucleotidase domain-containing protein [Melioribacter roseus P3M-2]|uniref:5'-nucleotidase domain-containing protein n=1 Tax=Melioribacter roseus (strain DSM 23840 / JCM 17771 / VKM B-2668 / P3M-2) TaxID=1191523 RepID=I6YZ56_MELRP|nr:T9SS type A sorting domain-containing protein [Melioribacter roseus]AFN75857.1 5'-nucleotidase domain-containing protein [Melioribacter roseus P3M-2]
MKFNYRFLILALLIAGFFMPVEKISAQAGDTLVVEWQDPVTGEVITDALRNAIENDTNRPEGRVYKLLRGGFYWISEKITYSDFHLRLVGEKGGPTEFDNPPVLQLVGREDGTHADRLMQPSASLTMKNIYVIGCDEFGSQTYYQPIQLDANDSRFVFDGCIFERTNFAPIAFTGKNNDIFVTNCVFRNIQGHPADQQWQGRGISIWADQDTVIVENNTFFNINMTVFQLEGGAANYIRFNHNTIVNMGRALNAGNWWKEAYFTNNLFINPFWHGEGHADITATGRDPRTIPASIFSVGALPTKYGPEEGRRILFSNAYAWRDPAFAAYYGDTIVAQPFAGPMTREDYFDVYENMVIKDTVWLSSMPSVGTYPSEIVENMIQNIKDIRSNTLPATEYFWKLPIDNITGDVCNVCPSWPLPEDFSYTDAALMTAGTDGLPLGDLNWFPDKKAIFEQNKDQYVAQLEAMAGPRIELETIAEYEAEEAVLGGDAEIKDVAGFMYFQMDGGGYIQWEFDLAEAGQYDLNIYTNLRGNGTRGQRIIVNGVSIHDPMGWGEYIWSPKEQEANIWYGKFDPNEWVWTLIKQEEILEAGALTLPAGKNTIRIESSWGYQNFAGIQLIPAGTTTPVVELGVPDATSDLVKIMVEGAVWVPSGLKSVAMNSNGSVTFTVEAPGNGTYALNLLYQNYSGPQNGVLKIDGAVVSTISFASKDDSTGLTVLTDKFELTQGSHQITVEASNINLDMAQLVKVTITSVNENEIPNGYALEQNFPNPFNPTTSIRFTLAKPEVVKLTVYNILGQKVATLVNGPMTAGQHLVHFNASNLASGIYFYGIEAGNFKTFKKMILLK